MQYWDPHPNKHTKFTCSVLCSRETVLCSQKNKFQRNNEWNCDNFTILGNALLYTVLSLTALCLWIEKIIIWTASSSQLHGRCNWLNFKFIHTFPFKYYISTSRNVSEDLILALAWFFNSLSLCIANNRSLNMDIMFFIINLSKFAKIMSRKNLIFNF